MYKGTKLINDDSETVDGIGKSANVQCTIFLKDMRIATTIFDGDKRAVGTKDLEKVTKKVLDAGEEYIGTATVLNVPYKTIYMPIKDKSGSNIGMFFISIEKQLVDRQVNNILIMVSKLTILLSIIAIILVTLFSSCQMEAAERRIT